MGTVGSEQYEETGQETAGLECGTFMDIGEEFIDLNADKAKTHQQRDAHEKHHRFLIAVPHSMNGKADRE
ncbi:hypothetical protein D3C86_2147040 [compost metagenome]